MFNRRCRGEESDLDRMEYLFILSLESGVFSQRYQISWKNKVALWVSGGKWEKDRGALSCLSHSSAMPR